MSRYTSRNAAVAMFLVLAVYVTWLAWSNERHSCERQTGSRNGIRLVAGTAWNARLNDADLALKDGDTAAAVNFRRRAASYLQAWRDSGPLDCSGMFPDTTTKDLAGKPVRMPIAATG